MWNQSPSSSNYRLFLTIVTQSSKIKLKSCYLHLIEFFLLFGVLAPALKCNCGFSLIFLTLGLGLEKFIQHRLRWFGHV